MFHKILSISNFDTQSTAFHQVCSPLHINAVWWSRHKWNVVEKNVENWGIIALLVAPIGNFFFSLGQQPLWRSHELQGSDLSKPLAVPVLLHYVGIGLSQWCCLIKYIWNWKKLFFENTEKISQFVHINYCEVHLLSGLARWVITQGKNTG